jgi:selenocysteine-specific translation elongation factor
VRGGIISIVSPSEDKTKQAAEKMGKLQDKGDLNIYYRKQNDYILSTIVPTQYPLSIINTLVAISLSNKIIILLNDNLDWKDGELLLAANSSGIDSIAIHNNINLIKKLIESSNINVKVSSDYENEIKYQEPESRKEDFVYIDRVFTVKGVGAVMLGFTFMDLKVHDKMIALPSMQPVEVKSIQVLDEDQESVGPGVRVGLALKNVKADDVKDTYALIPEDKKWLKSFEGEFVKYPWSEIKENGQYHFISGGVILMGQLKFGDKAKVELTKPMPKFKRIIVADVNAKSGKSRIIGYLKI